MTQSSTPVRPGGKPAALQEYYSPPQFPTLFKNRNFLLLWAGAVISALGDRIHMVVMLALIERMMQKADPHFAVGTMEQSQLTIMMLLPFFFVWAVHRGAGRSFSPPGDYGDIRPGARGDCDYRPRGVSA